MVGIDVSDPQNWEKLTQAITKVIGFNSSHYSKSFLMRRVEVRLRATNLNSYEEYSRLLMTSEDEKKKLDKELTIHVTNFFRDTTIFEVFTNEVLPYVFNLKEQQNRQRVKIWSAGCSTGEEAISIAICVLEAKRKFKGNISVEILGTDLDPQTVAKANQAHYEELQFREMKDDIKQKYFNKVSDNMYTPHAELRQLITFKQGDILGADKPKSLDIIFCRNTVIYFDILTKSKLYKEFYENLLDKGFLVLGKTEILQGDARNLFKIFNGKERIYQKDEQT